MIAAVDIAARVPARITAANAPDWLAAELQSTSDGIATVVFHSIVWPYLGDENRQRVTRTLDQAGRRASSRAPLAWLRMEPAGDLAEVRLTTWPGGDELLIARSGYHGIPVQWLAT
jgi:hypothetical protein